MDAMATRRLLLMRHGKSDWPDGVPDRERPLSSGGRKDCKRVAAALVERGLLPDYVVMSPAQRTRETWERLRSGLGIDPAASTDERIYANSVDELLEVIRETPAEYATLLLVGHNPSTEVIAGLLGGASGAGLRERLGAGYPTGTLATFELDEAWDSVELGVPRWLEVIIPRELR